MKKRALKLIVSRFIIFFFGLLVGINYYLAYEFYPNLTYCKCLENFTIVFLIVQIIEFLFTTFMAFVAWQQKLCLSNWLGIGGTYALIISNILALTTPIQFTFYKSIHLQIGLTMVFVISALYLLKRKE